MMATDTAALVSRVWPDWRIEDDPIYVHGGEEAYPALSSSGAEEARAAITVYSVQGLQDPDATVNADDAPRQDMIPALLRGLELQALARSEPHIVAINDRAIVRDEGGDISHILVRTEPLTPLDEYVIDHALTEADVTRMGMALCEALSALAARGIVHQDVRLRNVYVDSSGEFKLGGFAMASTVEALGKNPSARGAKSAIAPEIYHGERVDARADIYSLGMMLYRLMNRQRLPFVSMEKQLVSFADRSAAFRRRMRGEALPPPCEASEALSAVILRACAFAPAERYADAEQMRRALEQLLLPEKKREASDPPVTEKADDLDRTVAVRRPTSSPRVRAVSRMEAQEPARAPQGYEREAWPPSPEAQVHTFGNAKRRSPIKAVAVIAVAVLLAVAVALVLRGPLKRGHDDGKDAAVETASEVTATPTIEPTEVAAAPTVEPTEVAASPTPEPASAPAFDPAFCEGMLKTYSGAYTDVNKVKHHFTLEVRSCAPNGEIEAVFTFWKPVETREFTGQFRMRGTARPAQGGSVTAFLEGTEWIQQYDARYSMLSDTFTFDENRSHVTSERFLAEGDAVE